MNVIVYFYLGDMHPAQYKLEGADNNEDRNDEEPARSAV